MVKRHRSLRAAGALSLVSGVVAGCHNATLCEPAPADVGQIVTSAVSETYLAQVDKAGADVPHVACKAETVIASNKVSVPESEDGNCISTGKYCLGSSSFEPRLAAPLEKMHTTRGELRVLGIGKGISLEDCSKIAIKACNAAIDNYYGAQRAIRPPTFECRMDDYQNMCEPGDRKPRVPLAAVAPEPEMSPEDRLPATWIARLDNAKSRPVAVRALVHFHTDAMMRAGQNAGDPAVQGVLDQIVEPLTKVYVESHLERSTRVLLIHFLAETRDPRAGRAFIHACHGFATAAGPDEEDVSHAAAAIAATKLDEAAPALGEAFAKVEAGTAQGATASKNIRLAMLQLKSAVWKPMLLEKIGRPIDGPTQIFWQQTSVEILGSLGDASATKPLLKVLLEKDKAEIARPALVGIVKIGAGAVPILLDVLAGKDADMIGFAKSKAADASGNAKSYVAASAIALGAIGRADARAPMMQALKAADNEMNRAVLARELTALPATREATKAFQAAYDKVPATASIWPSTSSARPALLAASARFYDADTVPWLLLQAQAAEGKDEETMRVALMSAIEVMKGAHVAKVKAAVFKIGGENEKRAFQAATEVLEQCAEDVECYLARLKDGDTSNGLAGVKAAYMVGMLGDTRAGMEVVKLLPSVRHADVRSAALLAVDHAVQKDAAAVADALQNVVDEQSNDGAPMSTAAEQLVYRLRAR